MTKKIQYIPLYLIFIFFSCKSPSPDLHKIFIYPPESAKPWVFWYWRKAAVSKEGIKRELIAMKEQGLGGAYLFTVQGVENPPLFEPPAEQLSTYWWELLGYTFKLADSLNFKLGMHSCDGFTVAGGPWITPEMSMQKVVWKDTTAIGGKVLNLQLPQPESYEGFYKDIAIFAYPTFAGAEISTRNIHPKVTSSIKGQEVEFLSNPDGKKRFRSEDSCWIRYEFKEPFTCRTIEVHTVSNNLQSHRLIIEVSDDGKNFRKVTQLEPPRHGWQDADAPITHSMIPTTARFFRFIYSLNGTLPAAEDYDAAKWRQSLKIAGIVLSGKPIIHQFEGKAGNIWRISETISTEILPDSLCVSPDKIIDLREFKDSNGILSWNAPAGKWTILRIGHTSTGHTNYIGGAGVGLECDKLNPEAVRLQFDNWFGKVFDKLDPQLVSRVLKVFHVDSWEAGSQNWSPVFRDEFLKRRGYDLYKYLPVMTGLPLESAEVSEQFLYDIRLTITELLTDNFFGTLADLARRKGCVFSAESVAPTFTSDGMLHFKEVDIPMGEFWHSSPTHDKPNDILDAVSAAHIYGKRIIQSESFTTLRMQWDEHPGLIKNLQDRNYALGINRMFYHVLTHNPWIDRKPGMTLNGVGLYFQPDQTWWKQGKAWVEYAQRCQSLLQQGLPVVDIAVFTGEEIPCRAFTPDRLIPCLPGLFDQEALEKEKKRIENMGIPYQEKPKGVVNTANTFDPADWIDPLNGYQYDSFNKDALLKSKVKNGKTVFPGGVGYNILVVPGNKSISIEVANKLVELIKQGATVLICEKPHFTLYLNNRRETGKQPEKVLDNLYINPVTKDFHSFSIRKIERGIFIEGIFASNSLTELGIEQDFFALDSLGDMVDNLAWCHRADKDFDIYFISNQENIKKDIIVSLRVSGRIPEIYNPVNGNTCEAGTWNIIKNRTSLPLLLDKNESIFIVLQKSTKKTGDSVKKTQENFYTFEKLNRNWLVSFDTVYGGPDQTIVFDSLVSWTENSDNRIKYYSGTASYLKTFQYNKQINKENKIFLEIEEVHDIAQVFVNGIDCGIIWTPPYKVEISNALKMGENELKIDVTNTWRNRLIGDHYLNPLNQVTETTAPYRLDGVPLCISGITGQVVISAKQGE